MLTSDEERARAIAAELDRANSERRDHRADGGRGGRDGALRAARAPGLGARRSCSPATDWHPGVVGIAASRLAERHFVPTVLIGIDSEGRGRGSGRSIPGFDLLGALDACGEHLTSYGGHRAAAGLEIEAGRIDGVPRGVRRPRVGGHAIEDPPRPHGGDRRGRGRREPGPRRRRAARAAGAVRHGQPRRAAARAVGARRRRAADGRGRQARAVPARERRQRRRSGSPSASTGSWPSRSWSIRSTSR